MTLSLQKRYELLNKWFDTPQGMRVAEAFVTELSLVASEISGKVLLQLGDTGKSDLLKNIRLRQKHVVSPDLASANSSCYATISAMPFAKSSIDCVLAPLSMEIFARNQDCILEIDRVLKPNGLVIFFGINPFSFWGTAVFLRRVQYLSKFSLKLRSSLTIKNLWLNLGYRQCFLNSFYYIPPVKSLKLINNLEFLNEMGKMMWPYPASFYCFIAQKCEPGSYLLCSEQEDIDFAFKPN